MQLLFFISSCSGVKDLQDLEIKILNSASMEASASHNSDIIGALYSFLEDSKIG